MLERRLYLHLDWLLLGAIVCLTTIGVAMIYSTTGSWRLPTTQIYAIVIGAVAFGLCLMVDYRALTDKSHFIYLTLLGLLIYVLLFGTSAGGARRWISLGAFNLQPSEFAKVGVALVLAKFFGENRRGAPTTGDLLIAGALAGAAAHPDRARARPRNRGDRSPNLSRYRICGRDADPYHRHPRRRRHHRCADRVELRAQAVSEKPRRDVPRPLAGSEGRGLPADSGPDYGWIWRTDRQRLPEGHTGPAEVPAGRPQ